MRDQPAEREQHQTPVSALAESDNATLGSVVITLPAEVNYTAANHLLTQLRAARDADEVVIDAGAVARISTAAVLVLLSFLRTRADRKPPAVVHNPTGEFVDAFSELGLFSSLMQMEFRE